MHFLTSRPVWVLLLLMLLFTVLAMTGPILVRQRIPLARLRTNNEVAGFKFAVIGVLYAVLLGFVVIIAWERWYDAEKALAAEAGSAATIYRLSIGLGDPAGAALRADMSSYLKSVLADDWPAMAVGRWSLVTTRVLTDLYAEVVRYHPSELQDSNLQKDLLNALDQLTRARRDRLVMAQGTVPNAIWFVLFLGAALTICFTFFFGAEHVGTQSLMTGVLAALILSSIFVVVAIDRPYTGAIMVPKDSIRAVLEDLRSRP